MKNKQLYDKTLSILIDAYMNNTLENAYCTSCAIGNIIAANCGYKLIKDEKATKQRGRLQLNWLMPDGTVRLPLQPEWSIFSVYQDTMLIKNDGKINDKWHEAIKQIGSTGYSLSELNRIEFAFETRDDNVDKFSLTKDERLIYGLLRVIDMLNEIHENTVIKVELKSTVCA